MRARSSFDPPFLFVSSARPDIDGHMLDLQHFIGALYRMSVHCFSGVRACFCCLAAERKCECLFVTLVRVQEWSARYPSGEDKARMLLHVLDHSHKLFKVGVYHGCFVGGA